MSSMAGVWVSEEVPPHGGNVAQSLMEMGEVKGWGSHSWALM